MMFFSAVDDIIFEMVVDEVEVVEFTVPDLFEVVDPKLGSHCANSC